MTHDDYLYLIEFFLKHGKEEVAEDVAKIMKVPPVDVLSAPRKRIIDAGFVPQHV